MRQPIEDHKENIYESVQEYQKSIVTTAKEEPVAHVNPPHCNVSIHTPLPIRLAA